jgi:hypothetical protein
LNDDGGNNDNKEELVVEKVLEDIVFLVFEFSCIDFVEDLKEHEDIEENRVVFSGFIIPVLDSNGRGNSEDFRTLIKINLPLKRMTPRMTI